MKRKFYKFFNHKGVKMYFLNIYMLKTYENNVLYN